MFIPSIELVNKIVPDVALWQKAWSEWQKNPGSEEAMDRVYSLPKRPDFHSGRNPDADSEVSLPDVQTSIRENLFGALCGIAIRESRDHQTKVGEVFLLPVVDLSTGKFSANVVPRLLEKPGLTEPQLDELAKEFIEWVRNGPADDEDRKASMTDATRTCLRRVKQEPELVRLRREGIIK